jgi:hypothetical protein
VAAIRKELPKSVSGFFLVAFDQGGSEIYNIAISSITPDREINDFRAFLSKPDEILVCGTYGFPSAQRMSSKSQKTAQSTGVFFTRILNKIQQNIIFYNFLELNSANQLLGEKDIGNLKKKAEKKNKDIKEFSVDFTLILHPVFRQNEEFVLVTESFYPQYHSENFTDFDFYGRPYTSSISVFDGYRFTNAIITGFDQNGKLIWDNTMEIRNLVSFDLDQKVNVFNEGNSTVLCFLSDGKIASKIINRENVVEKLDYTPIEMNYPNDKLISETRSRMIHWYENYFLCYGYQEIKNISLENNNKRVVFYLNKIEFN